MRALSIRRDRTPAVLRKLARAEPDARIGRRMLAIASAREGMSRDAAAKSAGMDRQTLRDWVIRYNEHGLDGLSDRWGDGRPPKLTCEERAELLRIVLAGPDPETSGLSAFTRKTWCTSARSGSASTCMPPRWAASCASWGCHDRRHGRATRKKTRPLKRPLKRAPRLLQKLQHTYKKRIRLFFQDEARIGQKGRTCHVWWRRGERPPGLCDKRFTFAYIFAAVEPGSDNGFALVMPYADTEAMQEFLDRFSDTIADDEHVAMFADRAGWHIAGDLRVPDNITLIQLPSYSPSSILSSASGCTSRSGSSRTGCMPTTTPLPRPPATPGTASSPRPGASRRCAPTPGY